MVSVIGLRYVTFPVLRIETAHSDALIRVYYITSVYVASSPLLAKDITIPLFGNAGLLDK